MTNDIFTVPIIFQALKTDTEFLRNTGNVWRKINMAEADKVNWPGAGTIISMPMAEMVKVDPLDCSERS